MNRKKIPKTKKKYERSFLTNPPTKKVVTLTI